MKKILFVGLLVIIAFIMVGGEAFAALPRNFQEFKARYDKEARTPEGAAHLYFEAVFCYLNESTRPEASKMLRYALHQSAPIENLTTLRRFVERMKDKSYHYVFRSFAVGATPENDYSMSPDDFELEYTSKRKQGSDTQLFIYNSGADSPRSVRMRQYDGLWYMSGNSNTYVEVRPTKSSVDAKRAAHDADADYTATLKPEIEKTPEPEKEIISEIKEEITEPSVSPVTEETKSDAAIKASNAIEESNTIKVSNAREFLGALDSDRVIEMAPGVYNLSPYDPFTESGGGGPEPADGVSWEKVFDGGQLVLTGINNLTIRGAGERADTSILINPRYARVLEFRKCENIVIERLTMGHAEGSSECDDGVLSFADSLRISINEAGMFGCGTLGLELYNVADARITNSRIYECSQGIAYIMGGKNIAFDNCEFTGNQGGIIVQYTTVSISNSAFRDNNNYNPIHGSDNVEYTNCTFGDEEEETAVGHAMPDPDFVKLCAEGSFEEIAEAIKNGANVNAKDSDGDTALIKAAYNNENYGVMTALIEAGADVHAKDKWGWTALVSAVRRNRNIEVTNALIQAGSDVNAKYFQDIEGVTALMWASAFNGPEVVRALIEAGADVNAKNEFGGTPLMDAARNVNAEVLNVLIQAGADAKAKDKNGKTALDYAKGNANIRNSDALRLLEEKDRD